MYKMGGAIGLVIPKALREKLGLKQGEYMAIVQVGQLLLMRRVERHMVLDRDEVPADWLPRSQPARSGDA